MTPSGRSRTRPSAPIADEAGPHLVTGVSGIRGRVGAGLTPELMTRLAAAHGCELLRAAREGRAPCGTSRTVVVGRDSRTSGEMLRDAAVAGLLSVGCDVDDLGLAATPTVLLSVRDRGAVGGLVVTASHNPPDWNAAKLVSARGVFLTPAEARAVLALFEDGGPPRVAWDALGRTREVEAGVSRHVERILRAPGVDVEAARRRELRVVVDAAGGVGGDLVRRVLERLGCRVEMLNGTPEGRFPRPPEPVPAHLGELGESVRAGGADLGLGLDPDGDRLALVDARGRPVGEDLTLALAVERVLASVPAPAGGRPPVVTNLSTSGVVRAAAERGGATLVRTPVGEIHVVERMLELGSVIGGEGNGGVVLPAVHPTRDAGTAAALVVSLLAATGRSLEEAVGAYPAAVIVKETLPLGNEAVALEDLLGALGAGAVVDHADGVRLEWKAEPAWLHVRRSNTEPLVRLIAEAPTDARARDLVRRALAVLQPRHRHAAAGA